MRGFLLLVLIILNIALQTSVSFGDTYFSIHQLKSFNNTVGFKNQAQDAISAGRNYLYFSTEFSRTPHWGPAGELGAFKIFIPPGATQFSFVMYVYRDNQVGVVLRFGRPPDCSDCSLPYDQFGRSNNFDYTLNSLRENDLYLKNGGGTISVSFHLGEGGDFSGLSEEEAGWMYVKLVPYDSDYIQLLQITIDINRTNFIQWFNSFNNWDAQGDPVWTGGEGGGSDGGGSDGGGGDNGGNDGGNGNNGGGGEGTEGGFTGRYDFALNANWTVLECDQNNCRGEIPFSITPITDLEGENLRNWCSAQESTIVSIIRNMMLAFEPCYVDKPDNYNELPDGYGSAVRLDFGTNACPNAGTPLCLITANIDPSSVILSDPSTCIFEGIIVFQVSGAENVGNCRNLPHKIIDPHDPTQEIVTRSDVSAMIHTMIHPILSYEGRLTYMGTYVTVTVPGQKAQELHDFDPLGAYEVRIRVIEGQGNQAVVKAYIVDASGHYTTFPSNVEPFSGTWTNASVQAGSGDAFESTRIARVTLPQSGEFRVRYALTVRATIEDEEGNPTVKTITYRSNEIRFFAPVSCEDDEEPMCIYRPPLLRPIPSDPGLIERTNRPIFTGLIDTNGDGEGDTADYSHYTGVACDSCLATSRSYVENGYWTGRAAKDGIWNDWVADSTRGRVGYRYFTFINARPWDLYNLCPRTIETPAIGADRYDACADPNSLRCPSAGSERTIEGDSQPTVLWTVDGWECWNYLCKELPKDIDKRDLKCN